MPVSKLINVRLPAELEREAASFSREEGIPLSEVVRFSLREFLAVRKFRSLRSKVARQARKSGYVTDDDILNISS